MVRGHPGLQLSSIELLRDGQKAGMLQVSYQVQLSNGSLIRVDVFLVFSQPAGIQQDPRQTNPAEVLATGTSYQWTPVTRGQPRLL